MGLPLDIIPLALQTFRSIDIIDNHTTVRDKILQQAIKMGRATDRRIPMARPLSLLLELRIAVRIYQIIPHHLIPNHQHIVTAIKSRTRQITRPHQFMQAIYSQHSRLGIIEHCLLIHRLCGSCLQKILLAAIE